MAVVAGWQQHGGGKQRGVVFLCYVCALRLLPLALPLKPQRHKDFFALEGGPDYALWTVQDFALRSH